MMIYREREREREREKLFAKHRRAMLCDVDIWVWCKREVAFVFMCYVKRWKLKNNREGIAYISIFLVYKYIPWEFWRHGKSWVLYKYFSIKKVVLYKQKGQPHMRNENNSKENGSPPKGGSNLGKWRNHNKVFNGRNSGEFMQFDRYLIGEIKDKFLVCEIIVYLIQQNWGIFISMWVSYLLRNCLKIRH